MKILGIDEAGRGCVIGPMVLAAVMVTQKSWDKLLKCGVKDSKKLTQKKREALVDEIKDIALGTEIIVVPPPKIDEYCLKKRLNVLEAEVAVELIKRRYPDVVYIDAPGRGGHKFKEQLEKLLNERQICIVAENHADDNYPVVAAASILAKVKRDDEIEKLRKKFGDFGSGYPSDAKTQKFIQKLCQSKPPLPDYIRHSWSTVKRKLAGEQDELFT
ncbi:ribonuclease HII [Candidatus Uabimicrobium sp. HlEnr_7]|uniref:ribonuclease HII n=1 Tax=Candidatus Uabimicrobium helgolandensis TaxID=3095367 RepID=UPI003557C67F